MKINANAIDTTGKQMQFSLGKRFGKSFLLHKLYANLGGHHQGELLLSILVRRQSSLKDIFNLMKFIGRELNGDMNFN